MDKKSDKPDRSPPATPELPKSPPEETEPAQIVFEGGWGPGGSDIPGPPEPPTTHSSRIGAFPDAPDDESQDPKK